MRKKINPAPSSMFTTWASVFSLFVLIPGASAIFIPF